MTPEELAEIRYDQANAAMWLPKVVALCNDQAAQISDLMQNCNSLRDRARKAEAQISAMKEKLVEERAKYVHQRDREAKFGGLIHELDKGKYYDEARQQLKADPDLQAAGVKWE